MYLDEYMSEGYYDEWGNWISNSNVNVESNIPPGHVHDADGRLLKPAHEIIDYETWPEEVDLFTSKWQKQKMTSPKDWKWSTKIFFPDIDHIVMLKRLDLFQYQTPKLQQGTTDIAQSRIIRRTEGWVPIRSIFFMDEPLPMTSELFIETCGPPRRNKFKPSGKSNPRDLSKWIVKEKVNAYVSPDRIPGASDFYVDYCDLPDRYFISTATEPPFGSRRMYRFAAYSTTQYFILEKYVYHEALDAEGGYGYSYLIVTGPVVFTKKEWRIIGSFYGFDHQLQGSSKYTVYTRQDPFPSIHSNAASIVRHRMTSADPLGSWEFRMNIYVFPATLEDCTFTYAPTGGNEGYEVVFPSSGSGDDGNMLSIENGSSSTNRK